MASRFKSFDWSTIVVAVCMVTAAAVVYVRDGAERFVAVFYSDLGMLLNILPNMAAGCMIGVFATLLVPKEVVTRLVGSESGMGGLLIASFAGIIVPGGPLTVYPVSAAFIAVGADVGAALAFVTSWTLLGYNRALVWELPFFGPDFVFWRMLVAVFFPVMVGLLGRTVAAALAARGVKI